MLKAALQRALPAPMYRAGQKLMRSACATVQHAYALGQAARFGSPDVILIYGHGLGDDLMCTAALKELRKRGRGPLWMISDHPELFAGNHDASRVISTKNGIEKHSAIWGSDFRRLVYDQYSPTIEDALIPPTRHLISEICIRAGITGPVCLRPYLTLSEHEKEMGARVRGKIAIQSAAVPEKKPWPLVNKQWSHDRFQAVVNALRDDYEFVQLGTIDDPPLTNVTDYRGQSNLRETAAILHHTRLFVGTVGFLMHLARAVECPSVIVYGGREAPWQSGYICNINIYSDLPCAPCWRNCSCDFNRKCMSDITADHVTKSILELVGRPRGPLAVDTAVI